MDAPLKRRSIFYWTKQHMAEDFFILAVVITWKRINLILVLRYRGWSPTCNFSFPGRDATNFDLSFFVPKACEAQTVCFIFVYNSGSLQYTVYMTSYIREVAQKRILICTSNVRLCRPILAKSERIETYLRKCPIANFINIRSAILV